MSVSHTCPLSSGCPCHVTDRCGGVFGRFWGVGGGGGCCCFYPRLTPSFCPPDGCQLECSVTGLFLEGAPWNTPTKASLRINTSCSRAVWHVKTWVWFETWVRAGSFSSFFFYWKDKSLVSCLATSSSVCLCDSVVKSSEGTQRSWDVSWTSWGRTEVWLELCVFWWRAAACFFCKLSVHPNLTKITEHFVTSLLW